MRTSTVPVLIKWKSIEVVPRAAVPLVFWKTPALMKMGIAPAPEAALPSKVLINVAPTRLLNTAPLAPVKLPALQRATPGLTNLPPLRVVLPLMVSPSLAMTSALVTVPPAKLSGPATVTGLVPPSVPPDRLTAATGPALLKFRTPPPTFSVVPLTTQPAASVAVPAVTLRVDPVTSKIPLALRVVAPPLSETAPGPVTNEPAAST